MPKKLSGKDRMSSLVEQYASTGESSMLQLMMLAGVNPNLKGKDGRTLAHHAALHAVRTGDPEAIRKLADYGGCMHSRDAFGNSPLDILRVKPSLYAEINRAVLRGVGNAGIKDSTTVSGKIGLYAKKKSNQKTIKQLRGFGAAARPLSRARENAGGDGKTPEILKEDASPSQLFIRPGGARS